MSHLYDAHGSQNLLLRKGLKLSHLRVLAALKATGQVGAAAEQVGLTQPAASRLLAQLDEVMGTSIFVRHSRGVVLTEAGEIMAEQAVRTLGELGLSYDRVLQTIQGTRGLVRIGSVTGPSLELVLPLVREARVSSPAVEIAVHVETSDRLAESLIAGDLDFYIGRIPDGANAAPFKVTEIGAEPIGLVVRADHPLAAVRSLELEQCLAYDWVAQPPGGLLRRAAEDYILAKGLPLPRRVLGTTSTLFTLALVQKTNAIAPLAKAVIDFYIDANGLGSRLARLAVAPDLAVKTYSIIQREGHDLSPAAQALFASLQRCLLSTPASVHS